MRNAIPVLTVVVAILGIWYLAVGPMNFRLALDAATRL